MSGLGRRIERLEAKFSANHEARVIVTTINPDNHPEDPYTLELSLAVLGRSPFGAVRLQAKRFAGLAKNAWGDQ